MIFDIHSHILQGVDDGAGDINESVRLLQMEKLNNVASVMLTPHFYPDIITLEEFHNTVSSAFRTLKETVDETELPRIYLGAEVLYFYGLGKADGLEKLTLNGSKYILIELSGNEIGEMFFGDIINLQNRGFIPIIAHIERYYKAKNFSQLVDFVSLQDIIVQINASSVLKRQYFKTVKKLLKSELFCVLGSDAHSMGTRPPLIKEALITVSKKFGREYRNRLILNSMALYEKIVGENLD